MAYEGGADYERAFHVGYYVFVALMVVGAIYMIWRGTNIPPIPNAKAFGCYTTPKAAPILLDQDGMVILQTVPLKIPFHLERHKTGIALTAHAPIAAVSRMGRYQFSIRPPGEGWFLDFYKVIDGHSYGVFNENELRQFTMLARDGAYLPYRRSAQSECLA
jgi:hypothetical protein